ncbi:hypothetical protein HKCCD6035_09265 [Rhodobacterales bacterium HKCCD6035]|nr:hypothetical protein [Rhodobacterales bacterium HKCCD6035]
MIFKFPSKALRIRHALMTNLVALVMCSVFYAMAFEAVFVVSDKLQQSVVPGIIYGSVLFFPHGVRVLAAYLFGWRSILYLLPISAVYAGLGGDAGAILEGLVLALGSLVACVLAFEVLSRFDFIERNYLSVSIDWKSLVLAGAFGAMMNAALHYTLDVTDVRAAGAIFVGDVLGFAAVLVVSMLFFRLLREVS